jgi:hypothetical protein
VNFANGQAAQGLILEISNDEAHENDETVELTLSDPESATLGDPTVTTVTIEDDDPINTTITSGPAEPTNDPTPTFGFAADPSAGASFECSLDNAPFANCPNPFTTAALADGSHTLRVRAKNPTPAVDATPASRTFFVDTVAPQTVLTISAQPGQGTNLGAGRFSGAVSIGRQLIDPAPSPGGGGVQCVLDPPTPPTSLDQIPTTGCPLIASALGEHRVYAASFDAAGNKGPVTQASFEIVAKPTVTITGGPNAFTWEREPQFTFTSATQGATFECRLDSSAFVRCGSPWIAPMGDPGTSHTFEVRAVGPDGAVGDPARRSYTIEAPATYTH